MSTRVTADTSVMVKGLVPPRRRKRDQLYEVQLGLHLRSKEILSKIESGEYINHIPLGRCTKGQMILASMSDS